MNLRSESTALAACTVLAAAATLSTTLGGLAGADAHCQRRYLYCFAAN